MKEILSVIAFIIIVFIAVIACNGIKLMINRQKYSKIISHCKKHGYKYHSSYSSKGKGIIYSKEIEKDVVDALLLRYKYTPIEINAKYKVYDYIAIIKFPEWEERCYNITLDHGGIRLFHFYSLIIFKGDKAYSRPFNYYLGDDTGGEALGYFELKNEELIDSILSSNLSFDVQKFNNDEVEYWKHKTK